MIIYIYDYICHMSFPLYESTDLTKHIQWWRLGPCHHLNCKNMVETSSLKKRMTNAKEIQIDKEHPESIIAQINTLSPTIVEVENYPTWTETTIGRDPIFTSMIMGGSVSISLRGNPMGGESSSCLDGGTCLPGVEEETGAPPAQCFGALEY